MKMRKALDPEFRKRISGIASPYGDGRASQRIMEMLRAIRLGPSLLMKAPT